MLIKFSQLRKRGKGVFREVAVVVMIARQTVSMALPSKTWNNVAQDV
jgi:hypothetical protein